MDLADQAQNLRNREQNIEAEMKLQPPTGNTTKVPVSPKDVMQIPTGNAPEQRIKVGGKQPIPLNKEPTSDTRNQPM